MREIEDGNGSIAGGAFFSPSIRSFFLYILNYEVSVATSVRQSAEFLDKKNSCLGLLINLLIRYLN